jgi:hypothetical protein
MHPTRFRFAAPPESAHRILVYPLTNARGLRDKNQCTMLLQELIEASDDTETLNLVVRCLIREIIDGSSNPNAFALLKLSLARLGPHAADSVLFSEATTNIGVADQLARWLAAGELTPPGSYSMEFKARIESGDDPESVVWEIHDDIGRRRCDRP